MKNILLILLCFFIATTEVQSQTWRWGNGTRGSNNYGRFCSKDTLGNLYLAGDVFTGMNFLTDTIPSMDYKRVYISKFDTAGNLLWVKTSTGLNSALAGYIGAIGVTTDISGNTFMLGFYDSVVSFDANTLVNSHKGTYSGSSYQSYLFLAKFDTDGNNLWVKKMGNFPHAFWNIGNSLEVDCYGNVYLICNFYKNATIGSYSFLNSDATGSTPDMLVAKLNPEGHVLWAKQLGGNGIDYVANLALTPTNDILITGAFFHYTLSVGGHVLTDTSGIAGMATSFMAKLDNSGNPIWAKKNGDGKYAAYISDIAVSSNSDFYAVGNYSYDFTLDTYPLPYGYGTNGYLAKYNAAGNLLWAKVMKGNYMHLEGVTLDGCENGWVLGHLGSDVVITNDTIDGHIIAPPIKNKDPLFVSGWSSSGSYINTTILPAGGRSTFRISSIADNSSKIYIVGNNSMDTLAIGASELYGTSSTTNMFLAKYDPGTSCAPLSYLRCEAQSQNDIDIFFADIAIFPNPANSECTLRCGYCNSEGRCLIFDVQGRLIKTCLLKDGDTVIPVSEFSPGMYIFRIEVNGGVATRKVTIAN